MESAPVVEEVPGEEHAEEEIILQHVPPGLIPRGFAAQKEQDYVDGDNERSETSEEG